MKTQCPYFKKDFDPTSAKPTRLFKTYTVFFKITYLPLCFPLNLLMINTSPWLISSEWWPTPRYLLPDSSLLTTSCDVSD